MNVIHILGKIIKVEKKENDEGNIYYKGNIS